MTVTLTNGDRVNVTDEEIDVTAEETDLPRDAAELTAARVKRDAELVSEFNRARTDVAAGRTAPDRQNPADTVTDGARAEMRQLEVLMEGVQLNGGDPLDPETLDELHEQFETRDR